MISAVLRVKLNFSSLFFSKLTRIIGGVSSVFFFSQDLEHSLISESGTRLRMVRLY